MMNTFVSILVLCLSQASSQGLVNDLLCKKLGLLDGCDVGGLAAGPSSEALTKKDDLVAKKDKDDIKPPAEKLSGNIKDDFHDDDFKGRGRNNRNGDDNGRDFNRYSQGHGGRGFDLYRRGNDYSRGNHGDYYERHDHDHHGDDYGRRYGRSSYSVYRRSQPRPTKVLRRSDYGSDYRGDFDYDNDGYRRFGHHDLSRFGRDYNDDHHHNYEY